jgi:hypothetical protein
MQTFLEILKFTIPSFIVFLTAYFSIRYFIENDQERRRIELSLNNQKLITPIRLQAYERIVLFLERISPDALIMRSQQPGMTCAKLQTDLLSLIRAEFNHNLSQQIYISPDSWKVVKTAKENTIKLVNTSSDRVKPNAPAMELSKIILESVIFMEQAPCTVAIDYIKNEINKTFA